jgi:hypothetical protein
MELRPDEPAPILKDQVVMVGARWPDFRRARFDRGAASLAVTPIALLIGKGVRDVLPHSLGYRNDSAQKSAGNGNDCG